MIKKYWPIAVNCFLFQFVPIVMRHSQFGKYTTAYMYLLLAQEAPLLVAAVIVWRKRRNTSDMKRL